MKLRVYNKDKGYHLCIGVFYGYADYIFVSHSWEYLLPILPKKPDTSSESYYEQFCKEDCVSVEMTAIEFRKFISKYMQECELWYPAWKPYSIDTSGWKFKSLCKSSSNKILEWKHYDPKDRYFRTRV